MRDLAGRQRIDVLQRLARNAALRGLVGRQIRRLLGELFTHSVRAEHLYRHAWRDHDLVFWDNRSLMHLAAGTPDHLRRKLYRTTIEGDAPF